MTGIGVGSRVYWNDPDDGICSNSGIVVSVRGEIIGLRMDDGGEVEAIAAELSPVT